MPNIRNISATFKTMQTVEIQATRELIKEYRVAQDKVLAWIDFQDSNGQVLHMETIQIDGEMLTLLMSEGPEFAPGKPAGDFRKDDLWHVIDLIRNP